MNRQGNAVFGLMFFIMFLAVAVVFIGPIGDMLELAQQSDNLNCKGYVYNGEPNNPLSFNGTLNNNQSSSPTGCWVLKLYLPYILLFVLIFGVSMIFGGKAAEIFGFGGTPTPNYQ